MMTHCQYSKLINPKELKQHPKNRNKHSKEQIDRLIKILTYQGWRYPIKVSNFSGFITSGHGRLMAALKMGLTEVPVSYQDYESNEQEYADVQSDNAIASWSELDLSSINVDIGDLGPDFDLDLLGIKDFTVDVADKGKCDEDEVPEEVEPKTKLGDLYRLGDHKLLCGDSTDINQVEKLMNGEKADLWLTDPPYGVGYKSNGNEDKHREIANDNLPLEEMRVFWASVANNALLSCSDQAAYYWFACQGGDQMMMMMMMALGDSEWKVRHELIWVKDSMVMGRCDYHYKHEPILYGWKKDGTHKWHSDRCQTSVLEYPKPKKSDSHPTMKPVELIEYLIGNSTSKKQIVLDTFGGSGTTMIASEKSGRNARLLELDLHYCDVIVARWEKYTGKKAELISEITEK